MPSLHLDQTPRGRRTLLVYVQLSFLIGLTYTVVVVSIISAPSATAGSFQGGVALGLITTLLALAAPWGHARWMLVVAVLDVIVVALMRAAVVDVFPSATMLVTLPMLWAAYAFGWAGIALSVFGSAFVVGYRIVVTGVVPQTAAQWAHVVNLPLTIIGLCVLAFLASRMLSRHAAETASAHRAQAEALAKARDAETLVLGVLDTVDAAVAMYDDQERLEVANSKAREVAAAAGFRLDEPPYAGEHAMNAERTRRLAFEEQPVPRALRGEAIRGHLGWLGPPGSQIAALASANQLYRDDGSVRGTVIVVHDVTELVEAVEVREQFLRTVSHELRTPLTGVSGFLSLIQDAVDPGDTKVRGYLDVVRRRADDLIDRVRDLAIASGDEQPLRTRALDLRPLMESAARCVGVLARARGSVIEVFCAAGVVVRVDGERLQSAVAELMTNAVKFGEPGAPVTVTGAVSDDRVRIAVSSVGPGLTDAEQRRVFDRFYRTAHAREHAIQGFGLGLFTVRAVAAAHDGHVRIDSAPGAGTTVTLDLPAAGPPWAATPSSRSTG